ncbi:MAG: hypothetical protein RSD95_03860 [Clostridia bacterium]
MILAYILGINQEYSDEFRDRVVDAISCKVKVQRNIEMRNAATSYNTMALMTNAVSFDDFTKHIRPQVPEMKPKVEEFRKQIELMRALEMHENTRFGKIGKVN